MGKLIYLEEWKKKNTDAPVIKLCNRCKKGVPTDDTGVTCIGIHISYSGAFPEYDFLLCPKCLKDNMTRK